MRRTAQRLMGASHWLHGNRPSARPVKNCFAATDAGCFVSTNDSGTASSDVSRQTMSERRATYAGPAMAGNHRRIMPSQGATHATISMHQMSINSDRRKAHALLTRLTARLRTTVKKTSKKTAPDGKWPPVFQP